MIDPDREAELQRSAGVSLWHQIRAALQSEITGGVWQPGDRLPTEQILARRFAVNRHTVRRAVAALVADGMLRVEQGRGTFVQEGIIDYRVGSRTRFSENILRNRREPHGRMVRLLTTTPSAKAAAALLLAPDDPVVLFERIGDAGGSPLSFSTSYFPARRFPDMAAILAEGCTITEALNRHGVADYRRLTTRVTARLPTAEEAQHLRQPVTRPILQSESVDVDADGRRVDFGVTRFAADRVQIVIDTEGDVERGGDSDISS